jgi:hypothetical protein
MLPKGLSLDKFYMLGSKIMANINILKTDSRGRITLPPRFRSEDLFEYVVEGDQITLFPVRTVRKFPDMSDIPAEDLSSEWKKQESKVNRDKRPAVLAVSPSDALKHLGK